MSASKTDDFLILATLTVHHMDICNRFLMSMNNGILLTQFKPNVLLLQCLRQCHVRLDPDNIWLESYNEIVFYQLFRLKKQTFFLLLEEIIANDDHVLLKKKYRGGRYPIDPAKSLLVFLWYLSTQDTLHSIADRFDLVPSTVMNIVNVCLYIIIYKLKVKYIFWPKTEDEYNQIINGFVNYPGIIGAVDGTHVKIKVPTDQHDSYIDRYMSHSINIMAICTSQKIFTYVFVGFPGSAHDSRVFSNSQLAIHIEQYGPQKFIPRRNWHLIGDSAFPLREWFMTPYRQGPNITRQQKFHNYCLSANRIVIEHAFGILKGRWRRLHFINTYSVSKAIEIATVACIMHNYCYMKNDEWEGEVNIENHNFENYREIYRDQRILGEIKRNQICEELNRN